MIRLKAETLIETILASVILSMSLLFALVIMNRLFFSEREKRKQEALELLNRSFINYALDNEFDKLELTGDLVIRQYIDPFEPGIKPIKNYCL